MLHAFCASYVSTPVPQTAQTAYYPQPQPYDYYGQPYQYYGQQPVYAKYPAQPMYCGYECHQEEPPPPPPGIPPAPEVDEGGELDFLLKKEEDEAEPSGGAPEPTTQAKPEEKPEAVQEAEQEAEPEAKPEDKQQPADPREPPPFRAEPLLTQKGPEAGLATGGGTGCGCVPSHALLAFRMSGCDVALGTGGNALRVLRVLRGGFMRVPRGLRRGLHVFRVLETGCLRLRMKMMKNGTRTR